MTKGGVFLTNSLGSDSADPVGKGNRLLDADTGGEGASPPRSPWAWSSERKAAHSAKMKGNKQAAKKKEAPPVDLGPITPDEIEMVGNWLGVAWNLAAPALKVDPLDKGDQQRLGEAAAPVLRKYAPLVGDWALEINLVMVIGALYMAKRESWGMNHADEIRSEASSNGATESVFKETSIGA